MAHKKGAGSAKNGRDSNPQSLGIKAYDGELVTGGSVIVRQRGAGFRPGNNVGKGKDDTLFAKVCGYVWFQGRKVSVYDASKNEVLAATAKLTAAKA